jgi:hypothetical protein|tara:strand:+ start:2579 stop:2767 length:189 start_codon:yes stop_codon:yes gene_type:complete
MNIINYLIDNKDTLISTLTAIVAAASAIAALTPTPTDDGWASKLYKIVDWLALNVGNAKDKN